MKILNSLRCFLALPLAAGLAIFSAGHSDAQQSPNTTANSLGAVPTGWTDGYVIANGIRLHYWRTGGDKPVMVMAHGYSDDGRCWANFAKENEEVAGILKNGKIVHIEGAGHNVRRDQKVRTLRALKEFLGTL